MIIPLSANDAWMRLISEVSTYGQPSSPRGMEIKEVLGFTSCIDMNYPIVTHPGRSMGYKFLFAEAWWILSGRKDVDSIAPYAKAITKFSNDGHTFDGAYGPMVVEQMRYVVDSLLKDRDSRQAVMTVWRPNPRDSKDIPCTVALQFIIRNGAINCIATMRSSDAWLGWVYDVFNFSMIAYYIRERIAEATGTEVLDLGKLQLTAGSQHIYRPQFDDVAQILSDANFPDNRPKDFNIGKKFNCGGEPKILIQILENGKDHPTDLLDL